MGNITTAQNYQLLPIRMSELDLSPSTKGKLEKLGIFKLEQLTDKTKKEVKSLKGIGPKAFLEIEFLMAQRKLKFKKEPKKYSSDTSLRKKIISFFIKNTSKVNWAMEMRNADRLLAEYPQEFIFTIKPKVEVRTLNYFFNQYVKSDLDRRYRQWKTPTLSFDAEEKEEIEILDFKVGEDKIIEKPKTLKDFLN